MDFHWSDRMLADKVRNILNLVDIQNVIIRLMIDVLDNPFLLVLNNGKPVII